MMLNDDRICFIVVSDKKCYGLLLKYNFDDFMAAILNFMFYKKNQKDESSTSAQNHQRGTSQA